MHFHSKNDRLSTRMNQGDVRKVYEVLHSLKWVGNETGYVPMQTGNRDKMRYAEIDARLQAAGHKIDAAATKEQLLEELNGIREAITLEPEGLESEIERELQKQEELVKRIDEITKGMNEKIAGILESMEDTHIRSQIQMMVKLQESMKQKRDQVANCE